MSLVRESKIEGINKSEVWKTLLKHRWDIESPCLSQSQVAEVIYKTGQDLNLKHGWNLWIPEEDLILGSELYSVLSCPAQLVEAYKLSKLFESLINKENLNTVVAATMHNIQPRAGDNIKDFTAINMWYQRLDERYNFSLGEIILPLMNSETVEQLVPLDPPYVKAFNNWINNTHSAKMSLGKSKKISSF